MSKRKMFKQDGDLDFQSWLNPRSQENNKDFRERIELGVRYEYTRHSEAAKRALATAELEDQPPADREMLNALETNQGAWVWALRSLYPHLRHDRPFLVVPSADIASSLKMMGASAGFGRTKPHPLPALLSQIAPRPGHAISDRQVLMKWDRLHGKRRKPKAPEQPEGTATKTRRLSDDEADRHIPGRQFAEDGSELWLFTLQLEASTVEEIAAGMADHITQFAPSERPRINAAARAERKGNAIELLPLPPCIPEIDNGAGGYRSLVRIRWREFTLKEIGDSLPSVIKRLRPDASGLRGKTMDAACVRASAQALLAWRLHELYERTADAHEVWLKTTGRTKEADGAFALDTGKFTRRVRAAIDDFHRHISPSDVENLRKF